MSDLLKVSKSMSYNLCLNLEDESKYRYNRSVSCKINIVTFFISSIQLILSNNSGIYHSFVKNHKTNFLQTLTRHNTTYRKRIGRRRKYRNYHQRFKRKKTHIQVIATLDLCFF